jgi:hypothetical protein
MLKSCKTVHILRIQQCAPLIVIISEYMCTVLSTRYLAPSRDLRTLTSERKILPDLNIMYDKRLYHILSTRSHSTLDRKLSKGDTCSGQ